MLLFFSFPRVVKETMTSKDPAKSRMPETDLRRECFPQPVHLRPREPQDLAGGGQAPALSAPAD